MTSPINTTKVKLKPENLQVKQNKQQSLLNFLKKIKFSELRILELKKLTKKEINAFEFKSSQLQAVIFLFPKLDRFNALKLIVKHFDIKLSMLSETEIKALTSCLLNDPAFSNLLPFAKKNFAGIFVAEDKKKTIAPVIQKETKVVNTKLKNTIFGVDSKQYGSLPKKKIIFNERPSSLEQLRISIIKLCPESRLNFFRQSEIKSCYQNKVTRMHIQDFKNFIEIFPPKDAIKFLNLPLIRDQIQGLQRQNAQLSEESYIDLLRYFEPYQINAVKKLLRPISPNIDLKMNLEKNYLNVIASPLFFRNRLYDLKQGNEPSRDEGYCSGNVSPVDNYINECSNRRT